MESIVTTLIELKHNNEWIIIIIVIKLRVSGGRSVYTLGGEGAEETVR